MANTILHIIPSEKFTADFIERINDLFDSRSHEFLVFGEAHSSLIRESDATNTSRLDGRLKAREHRGKLYSAIESADRVVLHSLLIPIEMLVTFTSMLPIVHEKFAWVIWGGDLYDAWRARNTNAKSMVRERLRRRLIAQFRCVVANSADFEYLRARYRVSAVRLDGTYAYDLGCIPDIDPSGPVNVLLGNSANPTGRHIEAIDMLRPFRDMDVRVYCPLSYGGADTYVREVAGYGFDALGDKFAPIVDFMEFGDYMLLLSGVDVAIFNHDRQQAFGNITELLYSGKRVFVSPENPVGEFYRGLGAMIYSTGELSEPCIRKADDPGLRERNRAVVACYFSDEAFAGRWEAVFEGDWA